MKDVYDSALEAAEAIGVTRQTVQRWISTGRLKAERMPATRGRGGSWRILHEDLIRAYRGEVFADEPDDTDVGQISLDTPECMRTDALSLEVFWPDERMARRFDIGIMSDFKRLRVLTYTPSVHTILKLLERNEYEDVEVVFGSERLASETDAAMVLVAQSAIESEVTKGYLGVGGISSPATRRIMDWQAAGRARFYVVGGGVVHTKLYLLEKPGLRRLLVGSANLSERALSGRQGEVLIAYDNHQFMWEAMERKYQAVRSLSVGIALASEVKPAHLVNADDLPAARRASEHGDSEIEILRFEAPHMPGDPTLVAIRTEEIDSHLGNGLREYIKQAPRGTSKLPMATLRKVNYAVAKKPAHDLAKQHSLEYVGGTFIYNGQPVERPPSLESIKDDAVFITLFLNRFGELGGEFQILQRNYFALMGWMYFSPFIPRLTHRMSQVSPSASASKIIPNMAVAYGQSNCGKSTVIKFFFTSMFGPHSPLSNKEFTQTDFIKRKDHVGVLPLSYEDVDPTKFSGKSNGQAVIIAKQYDNLVGHSDRYPCIVASANAGPTEFPNELRLRTFLVFTPKGIASDDPALMRRIDSEVKPLFNRIGQAFYSEYLYQMEERLEELDDDSVAQFDYLKESTRLIVRLLRQSLGEDEVLTKWALPLSGDEYTAAQWELKHTQMLNRLSSTTYTPDNPPPVGWWTATDSDILIGVESVRDVIWRNREYPDHWVRTEALNLSSKTITLDRKEVERSIQRSFPDWVLPSTANSAQERGAWSRIKALVGKR